MSEAHILPRPTGRPRKVDTGVSIGDSALYKLLERKLPNYIHEGRLNVRSLASNLNFSRQHLYRRFSEDRLTPKQAKSLIEASKGRLTQDDLNPFVYG